MNDPNIRLIMVGTWLETLKVNIYPIPYPISSMMDGRPAMMDGWPAGYDGWMATIHDGWMEEKRERRPLGPESGTQALPFLQDIATHSH